jgi:hypothetical protein
LLTDKGVNAWWLLPASVALVLTESLRRTHPPAGTGAAAPIQLLPSLKHPLTPFVDKLSVSAAARLQRAG